VHFAWAGSIEPGQPHYYRLQGPRLLAEYDNTQRDMNHVHTVWRDPEGVQLGPQLLLVGAQSHVAVRAPGAAVEHDHRRLPVAGGGQGDRVRVHVEQLGVRQLRTGRSDTRRQTGGVELRLLGREDLTDLRGHLLRESDEHFSGALRDGRHGRSNRAIFDILSVHGQGRAG